MTTTTTFTVTSNAVGWLTGTSMWSDWRESVVADLGEYAPDFDVDLATQKIIEAYDALLPEGMSLVGNFIYADADIDWDLDQVQQEVREAAEVEVDEWALIWECMLPDE